jgi:hypothetical protein
LTGNAGTRIRYRRLPGRKMGFLRCPSAWIADDHILLIEGTRFHETYKRVYLRDLQALIIRRKPRFVMHWPYLLLLPFAVAAVIVRSRPLIAIPIVLAILMTAFLVTLLSLRSGCYMDLATAVGNVPVRSVAFLWTARRFAQRVTPAITLAQQPPESLR